MVKLRIRCVCSEMFETDVSEARFKEVFKTTNIAPLVLPHNDHFVTAYVDKDFDVRDV